MLKIIKDIRYYESKYPNQNGYSLPTNLGNLYLISKANVYIGIRFSLKLREMHFSLNDYDHLYINLTPLLDLDESSLSTRILEKWFRYVDYGYPVEKMNSLDDNKKLIEIQRITKEVLTNHCCNNEEDKNNIEIIYNQLIQQGEDTDILYRSLTNKQTTVNFVIRVLDNGKVDLYYNINGNNNKFIQQFNNMSEINCMLGSISINQQKLTIIPAKSRDSKYYNLNKIELDFF